VAVILFPIALFSILITPQCTARMNPRARIAELIEQRHSVRKGGWENWDVYQVSADGAHGTFSASAD
jgi:hypothetical protein